MNDNARPLIETGAGAGDYVLGFKNYNRGLCLRLTEEQKPGGGPLVGGTFEVVLAGTGSCKQFFERLAGGTFTPELFLKRAADMDPSAAAGIHRDSLRSIHDLRRQLVELANSEPAQPFRLLMSGNHFVDVKDPKLVLIDSQTLIVGIPDDRLPPPAALTRSLVSLLHVKRLKFCRMSRILSVQKRTLYTMKCRTDFPGRRPRPKTAWKGRPTTKRNELRGEK